MREKSLKEKDFEAQGERRGLRWLEESKDMRRRLGEWVLEKVMGNSMALSPVALVVVGRELQLREGRVTHS